MAPKIAQHVNKSVTTTRSDTTNFPSHTNTCRHFHKAILRLTPNTLQFGSRWTNQMHTLVLRWTKSYWKTVPILSQHTDNTTSTSSTRLAKTINNMKKRTSMNFSVTHPRFIRPFHLQIRAMKWNWKRKSIWWSRSASMQQDTPLHIRHGTFSTSGWVPPRHSSE